MDSKDPWTRSITTPQQFKEMIDDPATFVKLRAIARGLGLRGHDAEDVAQDAHIALLRYHPTFPIGNFRGLCWRTVRNLTFQEFGRRKTEPLTFDTASPAPIAEDDELFSHFEPSFFTLPRTQQDILVKHLDGQTYEDIAEGHGISVTTAWRRRKEAVEHLKQPRFDPPSEVIKSKWSFWAPFLASRLGLIPPNRFELNPATTFEEVIFDENNPRGYGELFSAHTYSAKVLFRPRMSVFHECVPSVTPGGRSSPPVMITADLIEATEVGFLWERQPW